VHADLAVTYARTGKRNEAFAEINKAIELSGRLPVYVAIIGDIHAKFGEKLEANKMLEELMTRARTGYVSPYDIALLYVGLGDKEKALAWMDKAVLERDFGILSIKAAPAWDSLRGDQRFNDLLRRVGLP
jgi:Flp pilus assembly protein TadD